RKLSGISSGPRLTSYEEIVAFINELNASGVAYWRRVSPSVLTDLLERAGENVAMEVAQLDPHATARISVAWAGQNRSENWMDTGREYPEWGHHQVQIRDAVGAPLLLVARWLAPLLDFSVRALPRAYALTEAADGTAVSITIDGEAWTVLRERERWTLY